MKRKILLAGTLTVLVLAPIFLMGAFTNPAANIRWERANVLRNGGPLDTWMEEVEDYLDATTPVASLKILESTGATYYTTLSCGDQSGNLTFKFPTSAGSNGQQLTTNGSGTLSWASAAGTFAGGNISSDVDLSNGVDITSSTTTAHTNSIQGYADAGAYKDILRWTNGSTVATVIGAADVSVAIASTGMDVSAAGAVSGVTTLSMTDDLSLANGKAIKGSTTTAETIKLQAYDNNTGPGYKDAITITNGNTPSISFGANAVTVAIDSTDWDVDATGAMTGIGAITMDGLLTASAGATISGAATSINASSNFNTNINTGTSTGDVTIGNNAAGAFSVTSNAASTITVNTGDLTITGNKSVNITPSEADADAVHIHPSSASSGVSISYGTGNLTLLGSGVSADFVTDSDLFSIDGTGTSNVTVTSNGDAEDFTVSLAGITNSSLILSSTGTAADALQVTASAGGIDITANGAATDEDIDVTTTASINLTSTENAANGIKLATNGGASETILINSLQGTGVSAVAVTATAGGLDFDAAAAKDVDIAGGQVILSSKDDAAAALDLHTNVGTSETIRLWNQAGTSVTEGAEAVNILATVGGVGLRSTANLAKSIQITNDGGTTGTIYIQQDQGTATGEGAASIQVTSDDGGIQLLASTASAVTEKASAIQLTAAAGGIELYSGLNATNAIKLTADGGANSDIDIYNDQGTSQDAIHLLTDVGGVTIENSAVPDGQYGLKVVSAVATATGSEGSAAYFETNVTGNIDNKFYNLGSWLNITGGTPADGGGTEAIFSAADLGLYGAAAGAELVDAKLRLLNLEYQVDADCAPIESSTFIHFNCNDTEDVPDYLFTFGNAASAVYTANVTHTTAATDKIGAIKINIGAIGDAYIYVYSHAGQ